MSKRRRFRRLIASFIYQLCRIPAGFCHRSDKSRHHQSVLPNPEYSCESLALELHLIDLLFLLVLSNRTRVLRDLKLQIKFYFIVSRIERFLARIDRESQYFKKLLCFVFLYCYSLSYYFVFYAVFREMFLF